MYVWATNEQRIKDANGFVSPEYQLVAHVWVSDYASDGLFCENVKSQNADENSAPVVAGHGGTNGSDDASAVLSWVARVARVHA